jgi:putative DNA primase/helicase
MSTKQSNPGKINFRNDGVYVVNRNEDPVRIAPPILVHAFATNHPNTAREIAFTVIKFLNRRDKWKREIVAASMFTAQPGELIKLLSDRGYVWPARKDVRSQIIESLSIIRPDRDIRVTSVPGWCGKSFVLPDESYSSNGLDRHRLLILRHPTVRLGRYRRSGTLEAWKRDVARTCIYSTRARLAMATNFAAPNLRLLGLSSFGFNFSGVTSGGKTLLVRMAASASGLNSGAGPATWDGTPAAFEQRTMGHRDGIVPLDDLGHLEGDPQRISKLVTFRLAGNRSKEKAGQYVIAQNLVEEEHRVIALSTSEVPLWEHLDGHGPRRIRGEEVRMINVRACVSDMQDIFDGKRAGERIGRTVEERRRFVEDLERFTRRYQGEALRVYLTYRLADRNAKATLKRYMADYIDKAPLLGQHRWLGRIQRLFAAVYASACQAIDYGVLPWSKAGTLNAIKVCMCDAMEQMIANCTTSSGHGNAILQSEQSLLTEFKRRLDDAKFVHLEGNMPKTRFLIERLKTGDGIIRRTKARKQECLLFGRTMKAWYPDGAVRTLLTKLLKLNRILKMGRRSDTNTRQVLVGGLGRIACYGLRKKRLDAAIGDLCSN